MSGVVRLPPVSTKFLPSCLYLTATAPPSGQAVTDALRTIAAGLRQLAGALDAGEDASSILRLFSKEVA